MLCSQLNLANNKIGGYWDSKLRKVISTPEGPKAIADALLVNAELRSIDLSNNSLVELGGWYCHVKGPGCLNGGPRRWHCSNGCDWDACDVCHLTQHRHQHELELIDALVGINALADALRINASLTSLG